MSDCTEFTETECLPCGESEFLDTWNRETRCHQHKYCDPSAWADGKGMLGSRVDIAADTPNNAAILILCSQGLF